MKKIFSIFAIGLLASCSTPDPITTEVIKPTSVQNQTTTNTFTVKWESNQEGAYVEFSKRTMVNCKEVDVVREVYREREFSVTMESGQLFDLQIRKESSVKNPELYLSIWKGSELQYEQESNSGGFMLVGYVDYGGNIGN